MRNGIAEAESAREDKTWIPEAESENGDKTWCTNLCKG